jgi:hypothetical protein
MTQKSVVTQFMVLLLYLPERSEKNHETPRSVRSITSYANLPGRISSSYSIHHGVNSINVKIITYYYIYCHAYGPDDRRIVVRFPAVARHSSFLRSLTTALGPTQSAIDAECSFARVKGALRHKADHCPPS